MGRMKDIMIDVMNEEMEELKYDRKLDVYRKKGNRMSTLQEGRSDRSKTEV